MGKVKVQATVEEDRIIVKWDFTPDFQAVIDSLKRNVSGARFRPSRKDWTMPATVDNCHGLRTAFGKHLVIYPALADWYRAHAQEAEQQTAQSAATDAELRLLPEAAPTLFAALRPDQRAGVRWIADTYRGAGLIADKPGLGKTIQAIGGVLEAGLEGPMLVVCPKISVWNVWRAEFMKWAPDETVYVCRGTRAKREATIAEFLEDDSPRKWLIIVAEMLRVKRKPNETEVKANAKKRGRIEGFEYPDLFAVPWSAILADESQRLLGSLSVAKSNLMGEGLASLPRPQGQRRYAMSGTPFGKGGRVQGMFGTLHWLWPDEYTSFWRWAERHFVIEEEYVRRGKTARKINGLREGTNEEFLRSLGPRILRRTKEEVLPNLPPKQFVEVLCQMEPKQLSQYRQLDADGEVVLPGGVLVANGVLAEITRARQIANGVLHLVDGKVKFTGESCKIDALFEKMEERGILDDSGDTKIIVSSRYNEFLEAVRSRLEASKVKYHMLTGSTSDKKRDEQMVAFQAEGGPRVFLLNSKAGGVSITLDAADEVHCLDELDNPEDNEQLEDRAHRASRIHQVTIFYYRTEGTYDLNVADSVENKRQVQFEVLDGRRGIEDVRNWIHYRKEAGR
jgi:SNF2 family DNA or RNA helicase